MTNHTPPPAGPPASLLVPGARVLASDGMSPWDDAVVVSGPHQPLTSAEPMWLIRFAGGNGSDDEFLAFAADLRPAG